ncbi:hypothetical protein Tco_1044763 [Tanacetum coccineum]|uniref:Retrovirus-related Pol polyprotein from transposon TNT 1-94-like beta-barrel domain-containing protein n=1 Tax=Tanacetum coccineum TaxID=301880 RepID=A0ABQ5GTD9_9ASTR
MLKSNLEKLKQEKENNQLKIENFDNAFKSLDKLTGSQIPDKSRNGVRFVSYNAVPPPHTGLFSPPKFDLSNSCLEEFQQPEFEGYGPKPSKSVSEDASNDVRESPDASLVKKLVSDDKLEKKTVFSTVVKIEFGHPQKEDQGYVNSRCSRHMIGNMSYLSDFKEFDEGYVTFRGGAKGGKITSKGTLKTSKLDFKDVYFVKELQFNLFSVSQMCDKKNNVLFTDNGCFVLSPDFKLADESQEIVDFLNASHIRKTKRKATEISQSSGPTNLVADEIVHEERRDSVERVTTTATSLDVEQGSGGSIRCQEAMRDIIAQTKSKRRLQVKLDEEARLEREREVEASKAANIAEWDNVQAMIDADYELATKLQAEEHGEISIEERLRAAGSSKRDAEEELDQESSKRQKTGESSELADEPRVKEADELYTLKGTRASTGRSSELEIYERRRYPFVKRNSYMKMYHKSSCWNKDNEMSRELLRDNHAVKDQEEMKYLGRILLRETSFQSKKLDDLEILSWDQQIETLSLDDLFKNEAYESEVNGL